MVMPAALSLADIERLFETRGQAQYDGEPVTQLEHALQSAHLAEQDGVGSALIAAALLHDLGHLLHGLPGSPTLDGVDDVHQYRCLPYLRGLFDEATLAPIRLHVDAKRWLCTREPGYLESLSPDSARSLALQGGPFDEPQAQAFEALPHAQDALRLRRWDDAAKVEGAATPDLAHFLRHCALAKGELALKKYA